jgi:hypothetical protein
MDIIGGLQILLPDVDWAFLSVRERKLSDKARANIDQSAECAGSGDEEEVSVKAAEVHQDKNAEPATPRSPTLSARERAAAAAESRLNRSNGGCAAPSSGALQGAEACVFSSLEDVAGEGWARALQANAASSTSPVLALPSPSEPLPHALLDALADTEPKRFAAKFVEAFLGTEVAGGESDSALEARALSLVTEARNAVVERALHDVIAKGTADAGALCDHLAALKILTIRDLKLWAKRPSLLRESLERKLLKKGSSPADARSIISVFFTDDAQRAWCKAAELTVAKRPWLDDWITGV